MFRPLRLSMISLCVLLTTPACGDSCQTPNLDGEKLTKMEYTVSQLANENAELRKQFDDLADQRDAIFQVIQELSIALQDLEKLKALQEELEPKLVELQEKSAPQQEIGEIKQQLEVVRKDITSNKAKIVKLESAITKAEQDADKANGHRLLGELSKDYAKKIDLDSIKQEIEKLQKDLQAANEKLGKSATKEELETVKKDLENEIKQLKDNMDKTASQLQTEVEQIKTKINNPTEDMISSTLKTKVDDLKKEIDTLKQDDKNVKDGHHPNSKGKTDKGTKINNIDFSTQLNMALKGKNPVTLDDTPFGIEVNKKLQEIDKKIKGINIIINGDEIKFKEGVLKKINDLKKSTSRLDQLMQDWGKQQAQATISRVVELNGIVVKLENQIKVHAQKLKELKKFKNAQKKKLIKSND
jgi:chromosome segregation ATPase